MAFFPSRAVVVVIVLQFLALNPVYSSDLDQELRTTLAMNHLVLTEQLSALAQHSQALVQMAQGFQTANSQLSQELSSLIQLNKELATQQSSFLTDLTEMAENIRLSQSHLEERIASSQSNMTQELTETLSTLASSQRNMTETLNLLIQKSGTVNKTELCPTLPVVTLPPVTLSPVTLLPETLSPVTSLPTLSVPPEAERVSDGVFLSVKERKTWMEARNNCQEMGGDLASPPSDFGAFKTFVGNTIGGRATWLGGREEEFEGNKYLDGKPVNTEHWNPGQPDAANACVLIRANWERPVWVAPCSSYYFSVCRFG